MILDATAIHHRDVRAIQERKSGKEEIHLFYDNRFHKQKPINKLKGFFLLCCFMIANKLEKLPLWLRGEIFLLPIYSM